MSNDAKLCHIPLFFHASLYLNNKKITNLLAYTQCVFDNFFTTVFAAALTQVFAQHYTVSPSHLISTWLVRKELSLLNTS
jgi:hypothetical protein